MLFVQIFVISASFIARAGGAFPVAERMIAWFRPINGSRESKPKRSLHREKIALTGDIFTQEKRCGARDAV